MKTIGQMMAGAYETSRNLWKIEGDILYIWANSPRYSEFAVLPSLDWNGGGIPRVPYWRKMEESQLPS